MNYLVLVVTMMTKLIDITGKKFGRLTAVCIDNSQRPKGSTRAYWKFKCDCGNVTYASGIDVRKGKIQSCGCLHDELVSKRFRKHGHSNTKLYFVWESMKQRCFNPNNKSFSDYGGRGVSICNQWKNSFYDFERWSIQNGYEVGKSIDRIDVDGNYCPSNCRWTDWKTQANNRRKRNSPVTNRLRADNISGVRGVSFDKSKNKWVAKMMYRNRIILDRSFTSYEEAVKERHLAEIRCQKNAI